MSLKTQNAVVVVMASALWILLVASRAPAFAQMTETVGGRALGMGGAFVAVANDSSATWWNPGALAAGPFVDVTFARTLMETGSRIPARRERTLGLAMTTPPLGVSYWRFQVTDVRPPDATDPGSGIRQEERAGVLIRSLTASQVGVTLVQTIGPGVHVGGTLKYVRGVVRTSSGEGPRPSGELLGDGDSLGGGEGHGEFDLDVGLLAVAGAIRLGALVRHLREPVFAASNGAMRLPRQGRVGIAVDTEAVGGQPLIVSLDADVSRVSTAAGERRNLAFGAERWIWNKRVGVRGGGRLNTLGRRERTATAGVSVAPRAGLSLEAYLARGGWDDDRGWGLGARVSF